MGELTAGAYPTRGGNGGANGLVSKLVWGLLTAVTTAAFLAAGTMLLEHDRQLAQQRVVNGDTAQMKVALESIRSDVALIREDLARRDGRDEGRGVTHTGWSSTSR